MTLEEVKIRTANIAASQFDDEAAHSMEDDLYEDIIRSIAAGLCDDPIAVCTEAIKTKTIEFARWCG